MRRRDFIKGIAGSTIAWPLAAAAQQRGQKRRVAVLMGGLTRGEADGQAEVDAFEEGLKGIGWKLGGNIELDYRWPGAELAQVSVAANEIVAMRPDLVVSRSTPATAIMLNRGLPIVFVLVADPISSGFVQNLGHPGGSVTGFSIFETSVGGKWLGLLKEAAPTVSRVSLLFNPETAPFADGYLHSAQAAAPTLGTTVIPAPCGSIADIEGAFAARAHEDAGGIIIINDTFLVERRHLITEFATAERGVNLLRGRLSGYPSARRIICRSHPAWCAAWRLAGSGTSQIHAVDQSQGCASNRSRPAAVAHYSCRRGDRMSNCVVGLRRIWAARRRCRAA
jgi:putative tryptophan/tyrosine transport system substrate-binding protein